MLEGPCATLYPRVNSQSIPMGHLPEGKSRGESALMDTQDVRRINLRKVIDAEFGGKQARLASHLDLAPPTLSRIFRSGKKVGDVIRDWERKLGYEPGALDRVDFEPGSRFRFGRATARIVEPLALSGPVPVGLYHAEEPLADGEVEIPAVNVLVGAGNRIHTEQVQEERRFRYSLDWIQRYGLKPDKLVRYRVRGTSMDPFISDGSWITVEMGYAQVNDGGTYLLRYGDQISVKFLFRRYDGGLILRSFNPSEPDVVVPAQDLEHVDVLGRVVESTNMLIKPIK